MTPGGTSRYVSRLFYGEVALEVSVFEHGGWLAQPARSGAIALHDQLARELTTRVQRMQVGQQLPTEAEIMAGFQVSRTTVRRAIRTLVDQDVLVRRQGKGTFVNRPHIVHNLDHLTPFFAALTTAGKNPHTAIVEFDWVTGAAVPPELGGPDARALAYRRVYYTDDREPHAVLHVVVAEPFGRQIERADLEDTPLFHVLERKCGVRLRRASLRIGVSSADEDLARLLSISAGSPLLVMHRLTLADTGLPVESTIHYLLPNFYELQLNVEPRDVYGGGTHDFFARSTQSKRIRNAEPR